MAALGRTEDTEAAAVAPGKWEEEEERWRRKRGDRRGGGEGGGPSKKDRQVKMKTWHVEDGKINI